MRALIAVFVATGFLGFSVLGVADQVLDWWSLPTERSHTSAVWTGEYAFVVGGVQGHVQKNRVGDIVRFDTTQGSKIVAQLPTPRGGTASVWTGSALYVFGGNPGEYFNWVTDEIVRYEPSTGAVEVLPTRLPYRVHHMSAVWDGSHAYLFGGERATGPYPVNVTPVDWILRFDPADSSITKMTSVLPSPRYAGGAFWDGEFAYYVGGVGSAYYRDIVRFDPRSDVATVVGQLTNGRSAFSTAYDGTTAYIFGGVTTTGRTSSVLAYVPGEPTTSVAKATLPSYRIATSAVATGPLDQGNEVYIFGGYDGGYRNVVARYNLLPVPPTDFGGTLRLGNIDLSWRAPAHADVLTGYEIYRGLEKGKEERHAFVSSANLSFRESIASDTDWLPDRQYYYRITAVSEHGESMSSRTIRCNPVDAVSVSTRYCTPV